MQGFLAGITWTYRYSSSDLASESWSYPYAIAPLLVDLLEYMDGHAAPAVVVPAEPDIPGRTHPLLLHLLVTPKAANSVIRQELKLFHLQYGSHLADGHTAPMVRA